MKVRSQPFLFLWAASAGALLCACGSPSGSATDAGLDKPPLVDTASHSERCLPQCEGKTCGPNGCGGSCGTCGIGSSCDSASGECRADAETMVAMRDGVRLNTRVLLPAGATTKVPTVLLRTPYHFLAGAAEIQHYGALTQQGFAFVWQACRGTGKSEGELEPLLQEFADGSDAVQWIVNQPWSNGSVGTVGGSYEGFTALAAAIDRPEVKVVVVDGTARGTFESWPSSTNGVADWGYLWWIPLVASGNDIMDDESFRSLVTNTRPLTGLDKAVLGSTSSLWQNLVTHLDKTSAYWEQRGLSGKLSRVCAPVLHFQAKNETLDDPLDIFLEAIAKPCSPDSLTGQRFVLGDHDHAGAGWFFDAQNPAGELYRAYLAKYLKGENIDLSAVPRFQYYLQSAKTWNSAAGWPVTSTAKELYLVGADQSGSGSLVGSLPATDSQSTYIFDPAKDNPCDTNIWTGGAAYVSLMLSASFDMVGRPQAVLHVAVDQPDTDIHAYLVEMTSTGDENLLGMSSMRLRFRDSFSAPKPMPVGSVVEVKLTFGARAFRVAKGSRLLLALYSASCGLFENPNTGGDISTETSTAPASVTIKSGPDYPSRLLLPVL